MPEVRIETIFKIWCPQCKKTMFVNNGNMDDITVPDIGGVICPHCDIKILLDDGYDIFEDTYYEKAVKTIK